MKLVDQWSAIEAGLPGRLGGRAAHAHDRAGRAICRGRTGARLDQRRQGRLDARLRRQPRRRSSGAAGGERGSSSASTTSGPGAGSSRSRVAAAIAAPASTRPVAGAGRCSVAASWDAALAPLPSDWTDLLCELEIDSSTLLDRTALLCAPLNPTRDGDALAFTFRCSGAPATASRARWRDAASSASTTTAITARHARSPCALRHGQRRHPGPGLARRRQNALVRCPTALTRKHRRETRRQETVTRPPPTTGFRAAPVGSGPARAHLPGHRADETDARRSARHRRRVSLTPRVAERSRT